MKTLRAVVPAANVVELHEQELDESTLGAHEILVETDCSFISAGTELAIFTGTDVGTHTPGSWCEYPFRPGYANAGRVLKAGENAKLQAGARVFCFGPHSSHFKTSTTADRLVAAIPDDVPSPLAAASRMAHVAITSLDVASPGYARWVGVWGLGAVGNMASQLFQLTGSRVIGIDPSSRRRELAKSCGIPHAIGGSDDEVREQIEEITGGQMLHIGIDAVGHSAICLQAMQSIARFGELIILGTPRVPIEGNLTDIFAPSHLRWITVKGALEWIVPAQGNHENQHSQSKRHEVIMAWLADGRLKVQPLISHQLPAAQIDQAYNGLLNHKDEYTGVVLDWKRV